MFWEYIHGAAIIGGFYRGFTTPLFNRRDRAIDAGFLVLSSIALVAALVAVSEYDGTLTKLEPGTLTVLNAFTLLELGTYLTLGLFAGSLLRTMVRPDLDDHDQS